MNRSRSHRAAFAALTALLLSGVLPALPHGHAAPVGLSQVGPDEARCPCPDDHLGRQDNPGPEPCPICSLTRLAAQGPVAAAEPRVTSSVSRVLPPVSGLLPERFLDSAPEARGPPLS